MILTPLQKLPKNEEDWGKIIVAKGFKKLPKVQNIAQSGHTGWAPTKKILTFFKFCIVLIPGKFHFYDDVGGSEKMFGKS